MKNKLLYLLTIIITLFTFNMNVNAAQELTCVYKNQNAKKQIILIQEADGNYRLYTNNKSEDYNKKITNITWTELNTKSIGIRFSFIKGEDDDYISDNLLNYYQKGEFNKISKEYISIDGCPGSMDVVMENVEYLFSGNTNSNYKQDKEQSNVGGIIKFPMYEQETTQITSGKLCKEYTKEQMWQELDGYTSSCLYSADVSATDGFGSYGGCHIVQINFSADGSFMLKESNPFPTINNNSNYNTIEKKDIIDIFGGECPLSIYSDINFYSEDVPAIEGGQSVTKKRIYGSNTNIYVPDEEFAKKHANQNGILRYNLIDAKGKNIVTGEELKGFKDVEIKFSAINIASCEDIFGKSGELEKVIKLIINIVKIGIPIVLIGLGTVDFVQAIFAGSEDKMKKAQQKFIKRLIIGVIIFLVPSLLKFILTIADNIWNNIDPSLCGII